ncbi:MAG: hypothetical protein ACI8RD_005239, partial [Bacillariaceae sp.]
FEDNGSRCESSLESIGRIDECLQRKIKKNVFWLLL